MVNLIKKASRQSVGGGVEGTGLDTADTLTVLDGELDVTLVTPDGGPGVLDEPVVEAGVGIGTVADGEDGVVNLGTAIGGVKDTRLVGLEDHLVSLDGDSEGLEVKAGLHLLNVVLGDVGVGGDIDGGGGVGLVGAGASGLGGAGGVAVDGLELSLVGLKVLEGAVLHATVATEVAVSEASAVNELLLGEGEELTSSDVVSALKSTGGGESPA